MRRWPRATHDSIKAKAARVIYPGLGHCLRCGLPWRFVDGYYTDYAPGKACGPLCGSCWTILGDTEARLPYYRSLVFDVWDDPAKWPGVEAGVRASAKI